MSIRLTVKKILCSIGYHTKPDFLIVGTEKAGTTSLFYTLIRHDFIFGSKKKELNYFDDDDWYENGNAYQYHILFPIPFFLSEEDRCFEATPNYMYHPDAPKRISQYRPNIKLIIVLRNPAYRALSSWRMFHHSFKQGKRKHLHDPRSFSECIDQEMENFENVNIHTDRRSYVKRGLYFEQIKRYYQYFDRSQILILEMDQLFSNREESLERICSFVGVPYQSLEMLKVNDNELYNEDEYKDEIQLLKDFYRPHNEALFSLIGTRYHWD